MGEPIRQCIACRQRRVKQELLRIVRTPDGSVEFDPDQRIAGRGVYVCRDRRCIERAKSKDLIGRMFDKHLPVNLYLQLAEYFQTGENNSFETLLGFAARSRKLLAGVTAVEHGVKTGKVKLLILDPGSSPSTRKRIEDLSSRGKIPFVLYPEENKMENVVGKTNCRCVGVTDPEFARSILRLPDLQTRLK